MPGKMTKSILRPPFRPPQVPAAVRSSRLSCGKVGKAQNIHLSSGVIWESRFMSFRLGLFSAGLRRTELRELLAGSLFPNHSYALEY